MQSGNDRRWYRCVDAALLRAAVAPGETTLPPWPLTQCPDTVSVEQWRVWLRLAWAGPRAAEGVEIATPVLARRIEAVIGGAAVDARRVRRMVLSLARYLLRAGSRATPYGVFAGVTPVRFAAAPAVRFGERHRVHARSDGQWLDTVVTVLESDPALLARLPVVANTLCRRRGGRLWVPGGPAPAAGGTGSPAGVSVRLTPAVVLVLDATTSPVRCRDLAGKLAAEFPATPPEKINRLIVELVEHRVLVSALRAPSTITDPLGHLLATLHAQEASGVAHLAPLVRGLHEIHIRMEGLGRAEPAGPGRAARAAVMDRMRELVPGSDTPLAVDLGLDALATLPDAVAREAEAAATVLARLASHPHGTAAWREYAERFRRRYGAALVPVAELTDPVMGLGYPAGYPGSGPERSARRTVRDERLLAYAQLAALDGATEVVLTEAMVHELETGQDLAPIRIPPHLEVCVQLHAVSTGALALGEFTARVLGVSRAAGTMTGRFLHLLDAADQARMVEVYAGLPTVDGAGVAVQLSFPPLRSCADHVTRTQRILPSVISLGEYPDPALDLILLEDLAVGCEDDRLYLASLATGRVLEAMVPTSLNYRTAAQTPPLARFLAEIARSDTAQVTGFDWGAATAAPFLPALRYGRTVLIPARWKLTAAELPTASASAAQWSRQLHTWRCRRRVPARVLLAEGDQQLLLDLDNDAPLDLLRTHLGRAGRAVLIEAPSPEDYGWIGGRAHSLVVPLAATHTPAPPALPRHPAVIHRDHPMPPGTSSWLCAELFVHPDVQDQALACLPRLLASFAADTRWWFERHAEPEPLLRLRIALLNADEFGPAAQALGIWAAGLRTDGLLRDLQLTSCSPQTGGWGQGGVLAAAERVFHADSTVVLAQLGARHCVSAQALAAANFAALALSFTGSSGDAMHWLARHVRPALTPPQVPRDLRAEAVRLADPKDDFAALYTALGSAPAAAAWAQRTETLTAYRAAMTEEPGTDPDAILTTFLHLHALRALGPDGERERTSLHLVRAAALACLHAEGRP
ncbi:MAG: lantibiotic dehydratase [Pseudonocardiales bacterium]